MKLMRVVVLAIAVAATAFPAAPVPQFQDRAEYELVASVQIERDPARRLVLLDRWAKLYPGSAFRQERWNQLITTYRALGHPRKMRDLARRMAADNPSGFGNYWLMVLTVNLQDSSPQALEEGQRAANAVLRNAPQNFSPANCPSSVPLPDWYHERDRQVRLAHKTLGWIALQRKLYPDAVAELTKAINAYPNDAEACFWMGSALVAQTKPELQSKALFYFARSLAISGKNELVPEARRLVKPYFQQAYVALHGSDQGIKDYLLQVSTSSKLE